MKREGNYIFVRAQYNHDMQPCILKPVSWRQEEKTQNMLVPITGEVTWFSISDCFTFYFKKVSVI